MLINYMFVNIFKIMESYNDNYIYICIVTNQQNIYSRKMKIQLNQFIVVIIFNQFLLKKLKLIITGK